MNWNAKEFIWLDWVVLIIGIVLVGVAVYLSIMKDKKKMKEPTVRTTSLVRVSPGG